MSRVKIDIFCHILPQAYFDRMTSISTRGAHLQKRVREIPAMTNLDVRFKMMDLFGDYRQVLSLSAIQSILISWPLSAYWFFQSPASILLHFL